jgi:hypothetical protein
VIWIKRSAVGVVVGLALALLLAAPALGAGMFPDVGASHPYLKAIENLASRGIAGGYQDGKFGPDDPVTRQQFAKMIVKTLNLTVTGTEVSPFTDVDAQIGTDPLYPSKYVAVCAANAITQGVTATTFMPYTSITRQQVISMVVRAGGTGLEDPPAEWVGALGYSDPNHGANIKKAEYNGLLEGLQGLGASWSGTVNATRGECVQMLYNLLLDRIPALPEGALLQVVTANGQATAFTLAQLKALPAASITVEGKVEDGFHLRALLQAVGVTEFTQVVLTGLDGMNVASSAQVDDNFLLDFTNRDTVKVATTSIPKANWAKDIYLIEVK